jgi:hypothetical protein
MRFRQSTAFLLPVNAPGGVYEVATFAADFHSCGDADKIDGKSDPTAVKITDVA